MTDLTRLAWLASLAYAFGCGDPPQADPSEPVEPTESAIPEPEWLAPEAASPLRRLTTAQYHNTVRDLFGIELSPVRFPAEGLAGGFVNNASAQVPSALWAEAVQQGALELTTEALGTPDAWLSCPLDGGDDPVGCGAEFITEFGALAFRRPLDPTQVDAFITFFEDQLDRQDFSTAIGNAVQVMLNSPQFLYRLELPGPDDPSWARVPLDDHAIASRLSYLLWNTMPDDVLRSEALAGRLSTPEQVEAQAQRMLDDPRASDGVLDFHRQWLELDHIDTLAFNETVHPEFDPAMNPSIRADLEGLILRVWESDDPTLHTLLHDRAADVDGSLSFLYDVDEGTVGLPPERAGMLTRAGWLAPRASVTNSSPVKRGVWVLERMLCTPPPPPPPDIQLGGGFLFGNQTTNREFYEQHVADPACAGCHASIDGIGFGFEHYNALGQWQDLDNGFDVDASGSVTLDGTLMPFYGAIELSDLLADSPQVSECVARQWYRHAHGRLETSAEDAVLVPYLDDAVRTGVDIRTLLLSIVGSETFLTRGVAP